MQVDPHNVGKDGGKSPTSKTIVNPVMPAKQPAVNKDIDKTDKPPTNTPPLGVNLPASDSKKDSELEKGKDLPIEADEIDGKLPPNDSTTSGKLPDVPAEPGVNQPPVDLDGLKGNTTATGGGVDPRPRSQIGKGKEVVIPAGPNAKGNKVFIVQLQGEPAARVEGCEDRLDAQQKYNAALGIQSSTRPYDYTEVK